jgi:FkbM family methyltransferase
MKLIEGEIKGIKFFHREGMSELKTFNEVLGKEVYLKKGMTIKQNETWMDCGGNVGTFTLLACSMGANVTVYEPDPFNCEMIKKNLDLNGFKATIKQAALVHNEVKEVILFIGNNGNVWRNSIVKKWNNKGLKVPCLNFDVEAKNFDCCKMDIEGAEMLILENTKKVFKKMVYEWSFDIDKNLNRFRECCNLLMQRYEMKFIDKRFYDLVVPPGFVAPCTNVFCYEKN